MMREGVAHTSKGDCGECAEKSNYRNGVIAYEVSPISAKYSEG